MGKSASGKQPKLTNGTDPHTTFGPVPMEEALLCLHKRSTSLHLTLDIEEILDHVVRESIAILGAETGLIAYCNAEGFSSYRYIRQGQPVSTNDGWSPGTEIAGRVILKAEPYLSNDALHDPQIDSRKAAAFEVRNALSIPLLDANGELIGHLEIQNKKDPSGFTSFDMEQLKTIAQISAQSINNTKAFRKIAQDAAELEGRVAERTAQLQEINQELDTFAYSVSHDLRAPLRAIQSFSEIQLEGKERVDDPERREYLARIDAAARQMDQLIHDLLDYSRLSRQDISLHAVSLDNVVREAAEQLEQTGGGGDYHLEVADNLPLAKGDHAVLVQVVLNLLSNAVKYVAPGVTPDWVAG